MDTITKERRSEIMRRIRSKDMKPELQVRRLVFSLGYRYRLHRKDLPGRPDLVFPARKKVIFVHGCFWHQHEDPACSDSRLPKSNRRYWLRKLRNNRRRDETNARGLLSMGWRLLVIWECEIKDYGRLKQTIRRFLGKHNPPITKMAPPKR